MSPSINVTTNQVNQTGGLVGATGTAFIPAVTDQGPLTGANYVRCQSLNDYVNNFGARSSTSATAYDWLDEFFHDGGQVAYVTRVTDNSATAATVALNDATAQPSVQVTASPGTNGNAYYVVVTRGSSTPISGTTVSGSTTVTGVTSFSALGIGTPITAATGVPANTYVQSVNTTAGTFVMTNAATVAGARVISGATFTTTVQDSGGNVFDTHGPYYTTAQLLADTSSQVVAFAQPTASGNTLNVPVAVGPVALTGGANASDLAVANSVSALANFPSNLGPGQVAIPGYANSTAWTGILSHAQAKNRVGLLDLADSSSSSSVVSSFGSIASNGGYGVPIEGSLVLPGIIPNTTRTVAGSAAVAALCGRVAAGSNQAAAPCGVNYALGYPITFTTYFGPGGTYLSSDVNTMSTAGINCFAVLNGVPCLYGFVTALPSTSDVTYWQATASRERMALVYDGTNAITPYLFAPLDGGNRTILAAKSALQNVINAHWQGGALYGASAGEAGRVNMDPPVNTTTTESAGQLNANLAVRITPYANTINETITTVPITVPLPA